MVSAGDVFLGTDLHYFSDCQSLLCLLAWSGAAQTHRSFSRGLDECSGFYFCCAGVTEVWPLLLQNMVGQLYFDCLCFGAFAAYQRLFFTKSCAQPGQASQAEIGRASCRERG